jgi:hypothetical protein
MKSSSLRNQSPKPDIGIYDCELRIKFTMIEEKWVLENREHLLETLIDALAYGTDEYLESHEVEIQVEEIPETSASAALRRQLIRLKNSEKFA